MRALVPQSDTRTAAKKVYKKSLMEVPTVVCDSRPLFRASYGNYSRAETRQAISDTSVSWIGVPSDVLQGIVQVAGARANVSKGFYAVKCVSVKTLPDLTLRINGVTYDIPASSYVQDVRKHLVKSLWEDACMPFCGGYNTREQQNSISVGPLRFPISLKRLEFQRYQRNNAIRQRNTTLVVGRERKTAGTMPTPRPFFQPFCFIIITISNSGRPRRRNVCAELLQDDAFGSVPASVDPRT